MTSTTRKLHRPRSENVAGSMFGLLGCSDTEVVDSCSHLGQLNNNLDVERCHSKLVGQINTVLCNIACVDANVKI